MDNARDVDDGRMEEKRWTSGMPAVGGRFFARHQENGRRSPFPGMLIKRILCGEDAILNNVDQSEARLGRLGGVAGVDEGGDTCTAYYH